MVLFLPKKADFLQKNADISKITEALVLKGIFSETTYVCMCVYLRAKCELCSIVLTSFRQGVILTPPQSEPFKKLTQIRVKTLLKL